LKTKYFLFCLLFKNQQEEFVSERVHALEVESIHNVVAMNHLARFAFDSGDYYYFSKSITTKPEISTP